MSEPEHLTSADGEDVLCTALLYGPGTWFDACRDAAAAGPAEVAGLFARLEPGHEVARALATRISWPGQSRLRRAGAPLVDTETGRALSAARAVAEIVAVLASAANPDERVKTAINHWRRANVLPDVAITGADISVGLADDALAAAVRRLSVLADDLERGDAAGVGFVVLLARALRDAFPVTAREVELPVLFDRRSAGGHGLLRIGCMHDGPPGLYPDPRVMSFLATDQQFGQALDAAWRTAPKRLAHRCVVWRLTADGQACDEVEGGSLGGAFGVGLAELARTLPRLGRLWPRRLDRRCAVTAGLAADGALLHVTGQRNKLEEAVRQRWRVVLAAPPRTDDPAPEQPTTTLLHEASVRYALDLSAAVKLTRTRVNTAFVVMVLAVTLAAATITGSVMYANRRADVTRLQSIGNRLLRDADAIMLSDPADALLLDSLAVRLGTSGAHRALVHNLLTTHYAGQISGGKDLCGGAQTWSPDGRIIAMAGAAAVTLWDTRLRKVERALPAGGRVTGCAFAPDGATLAAAADGKLLLFSLRPSLSAGATAFTADSDVQQVRFAPNGLLATAATDGTVRLWSITRTESAEPLTHLLATVLPDTTAGPDTRAGNGSAAGRRSTFAFSPDSRTLAVGGSAQTRLVDVSDPSAPRLASSIAGGGSVFSPDGAVLALGGGADDTTTLWDLRDLTHPRRRATIKPRQSGVGGNPVAFTPDGKYLITTCGLLGEVWEINDETFRFAHQLTTGPNTVIEADLSPDGTMAVVRDSDGLLTLWQVRDRTAPATAATLPASPAVVTGLAFPGRGGPALIVTTKSGTTIWNVTDPARPRQLETVAPGSGTDNAPVFSADGRRFAVTDNGAIGLWEVTLDGHISHRGTLPAAAGAQLTPDALSADGTILAVATTNEKDPLALWDVRGQPSLLGHLPQGGTARPPQSTRPHVVFSPDGGTLVMLTSEARTTTTSWWDVTDPAHPAQLAQRSAQAADSPGRTVFASDGRLMADTEAGTPGALWDTSHPAAPRLLSTRPSQAGFYAGDAVFHGHALVLGTLGAVHVWDVTDPVNPVQVTEFASGGGGPFIGGLAISGSAMLATVEFAKFPSDYYTGLGTVRLWDLSAITDVIADPVAAACLIDGGQLSSDMWHRYAPDLAYRPICP